MPSSQASALPSSRRATSSPPAFARVAAGDPGGDPQPATPVGGVPGAARRDHDDADVPIHGHGRRERTGKRRPHGRRSAITEACEQTPIAESVGTEISGCIYPPARQWHRVGLVGARPAQTNSQPCTRAVRCRAPFCRPGADATKERRMGEQRPAGSAGTGAARTRKARLKFALAGAMALAALTTVQGRAETLLETDGIVLTGTKRIVEREAVQCRIVAGKYSDDEYQRLKANEGRPLHVWRLEFSVHNRSGRALDRLIALYRVDSPWPPCTYWDGAAGVQWADSAGHIRRSGEQFAVAADATLTEEILVVAFHTETPRFSQWSVDFDFADAAAVPTEPATPAPAQEPAIAAEDTCAGQAEGAECWKALSDRPGCHVWDNHLHADQTVAWSGPCAAGLAQGEGTLTWRRRAEVAAATGQLVDGRMHGRWVLRPADGSTAEGPAVDGRNHGHWVSRAADGTSREGPFVDDKRHGHWVERIRGVVWEGR